MKKLKQLKQSILSLEGKEVIVILKEQRGKIDKHKGIIEKTFGHFFNIRTVGYNQLVYSFKYVDILTGEISVQSTENPELIIHNEREKKNFEMGFEELANEGVSFAMLNKEAEDFLDEEDLDEIEPPNNLEDYVDDKEIVLEFPYDAENLDEENLQEDPIQLDEIDD